MIFPSVETIEDIHYDSIDEFGGSHGLRDLGLLESAVARAANKAFYAPDASLSEVGASLAWGLIKNHAFIDGNKRVGLGGLAAFLKGNNRRLNCANEEKVLMVWRAAAGEITEEQWTVWVMRVTAPLI